MKIVFQFIFTIFGIMNMVFYSYSQDCKFYTSPGYNGIQIDLDIGESHEIQLNSASSPSFEVLNSNAACKVSMVNPPLNYPLLFTWSENNANTIGGTNQYYGTNVLFSCESKDDLPQPTSWIPIDNSDAYTPASPMPVGHHVLVIRKAFIWENSEDISGIHGPYGSLGTRVFHPSLLEAYNYDYDAIRNDYNEDSGPFSWVAPSSLGGGQLHGPAYFYDQLFEPDPKSEWIDGPWGVCYSNLMVFDWASTAEEEVFVCLREGDDTNPDDFLGGGLVNKNTTGPILIKTWHFGYIVVENIIVPNGGEKDISSADYYWNHSWNGVHPEGINGIYQYDQYKPLSGSQIDEMENIFNQNSKIGLLGGKFPIGILDKKMIYTAPCEPAVFDNN